MDQDTAITLKLLTNPDMAKTMCRPRLKVRHKRQRTSSWKDQDKTDFIDTVAHSWICPPIYLIPGPEDPDIDDEDEELVFDGAHKLEAVFEFTDNKFPLKKIDDFSILKPYESKYFRELPRELQEKIKNYKFNINRIDYETANNSEAMKILWVRLNKAGQKLNSFELSLPKIVELNNRVLKPVLPDFFETPIYPKNKSNRGQAEKILQLLLATSDYPLTAPHLSTFNSKISLVEMWQKDCLGKTISETTENTKKNAEKWVSNLKFASRLIKALEQANCFVNDDGKDILDTAHRGTEVPFLLGRCVFHFKKYEDFSRICSDLSEEFKKKFLTEVLRDKAGRNGILQRRILGMIDDIVIEYSKKKTPRSFSSETISAKRMEQKNICPLCNELMLPHHKVNGDHILPWSQGGDTTPENCQVTHAKCNKVKGNVVENSVKKQNN
jgi:hypothetical protein